MNARRTVEMGEADETPPFRPKMASVPFNGKWKRETPFVFVTRSNGTELRLLKGQWATIGHCVAGFGPVSSVFYGFSMTE